METEEFKFLNLAAMISLLTLFRFSLVIDIFLVLFFYVRNGFQLISEKGVVNMEYQNCILKKITSKVPKEGLIT